MVDDFTGFDASAQLLGTAVGDGLFLGEIFFLGLTAEDARDEITALKEAKGVVNRSGKEAHTVALPVIFGELFAFESGFEDGERREIRVGIGSNRSNFDARAFFVAHRDADH